MLATFTKIVLLLLGLWIIYALLTGHSSLRTVSQAFRQSAKISKSKAMSIVWWTLIAAGSVWIILMALSSHHLTP